MEKPHDSAQAIRRRIVEVVLKNGGHLASSLGAVEIAVALYETFDPERDRIVWDIGHQAYAWKLLTGRADRFGTLRRLGGLSGFPSPAESAADAATAGHAGVALSVAQGLAAARGIRGTDECVVAVVGDAAMKNGVCLEALFSLGAADGRVVVVLNDNEPESRPRIFDGDFFGRLGFEYIGPVDGNDVAELKAALGAAKASGRSVVVHALTQKGRGFEPAERDPEKWHSVGAAATEPAAGETRRRSWSEVFGVAVCEAARKNPRIVALTAAMRDGVGLSGFAAEFPDRFFDVGIAEEHMVAFAAGLASGGLRPVVAAYSTFLQRAVDQIAHDICLPGLPVVFCVDRAGVVGADGATHQGVFDIAMLRCIPNLAICQPKDAADLKALLEEALGRNGPTVIRYPRGVAPELVEGAAAGADAAPRAAVWATGDWYGKACEAARMVLGCVAVHARYLKPFDSGALAAQRAAGTMIASLENGSVAGGFGEAVGADLKMGWPDEFIPHGDTAELESRCGLDAASVAGRIAQALQARA